MNLITAQRVCQMPDETRELVWSRKPVTVYLPPKDVEGGHFSCEYGTVKGAWSKSHHRGNQRPCIHTMEPPAQGQFIGIEWACQLNWQPTVYTLSTSTPVIASRTGDIVTLAFDQTGPIEGCSGALRPLQDVNRWHYRLFPMQFEDDTEVHTRVWLGLWAD
jgi:hypothetical protein